jgi:hypothetical protein
MIVLYDRPHQLGHDAEGLELDRSLARRIGGQAGRRIERPQVLHGRDLRRVVNIVRGAVREGLHGPAPDAALDRQGRRGAEAFKTGSTTTRSPDSSRGRRGQELHAGRRGRREPALASRVRPAPSRADTVPKCPSDCVGPSSDCRFRAKGVFGWPQISGFGLCPGWLSDPQWTGAGRTPR